ncbi:hypothetical protein GCM10010448_66840 [Streptomyces glomeratus]|uniref:Uncharacterized protein n=1 Tax=Streptomyces glomeratus TaxID=284452 RepID=A0ABP6M3J0_9ACTN
MEDKSADRGSHAALWRDADLAQVGLEAAGVHRLPWLAAGEEPTAIRALDLPRAARSTVCDRTLAWCGVL